MSILPIYTYGQPVLRKKAKPVKGVDKPMKKFIEDMFETMRNSNGIGLAANQVGALHRVIVVDVSETTDNEEPQKPIVLINPEIIASEGVWVMEEGCLSIPDIRDEVERAETVHVRYRDLDFNQQQMEAKGLLGRVLLHEIDHLNGILFIDHLGKIKQKLLRGRLNKIRKGEVEVAYPVVTEEP